MHCKQLRVLAACLLLLPLLSLAQTTDGQPEPGLWIDLRSPAEFRQCHVEGAVNIPRGELAHRINEHVTDLFTPVRLYDNSAGTAGLALDILMEMGFQEVINEGRYETLLARLPSLGRVLSGRGCP